MTDQPTTPDYSKMPRPPANRPKLQPPPQSLEERQERADFFRRLWSEPADPDEDDGMTDAEVQEFLQEKP